ncbi:CoA transferase [Streptomyces sp. NPDC005438]|uniref:CaiB/BaiF CoA transferase family protein n=1 Tax=Streptomyces sp. NPDC005438 TaxID=3156880 RepID=UPI0033B43C7D
MTAPGTALKGMRVLDLSQQLPGPYATLLLASLGATVTKVEPPGGDPARRLDPEMFERVNAGKGAVTVDLKSPEGRERLYGLLAEADVFVESFRPGVTARLGCDAPTLHRLRPGLVYCSLSGVGQRGPLANTPVHDLSLQAMAGVLDGAPRVERVGVPWVDLAAGTSAALAITAAWRAGEGCHLDMSLLDAALGWAEVKPSAVSGGVEPTYGTFRTADGATVVLALLEDAMWRRLCTALGWDDWADDPGLAGYADRRLRGPEVRERLERALAARELTELVELARRYDLPLDTADGSDPEVAAQVALRRRPEHGAWRGCVPLPEPLVGRLSPAPPRAPDRPGPGPDD